MAVDESRKLGDAWKGPSCTHLYTRDQYISQMRVPMKSESSIGIFMSAPASLQQREKIRK